jgi:hypothetical protein
LTLIVGAPAADKGGDMATTTPSTTS